jgi:hypothetical protein
LWLKLAGREEIAVRYPNLPFEQVYATITYYLANREKVNVHIKAGWQEIEKAAQTQEDNPPAVIKRLRRLKQTKSYPLRGPSS